jgi:hypothetical protein
MKITVTNIDDFIREGKRLGITKFAWTEEQWDCLDKFMKANGFLSTGGMKNGIKYMSAQHYLVEDKSLSK